MMILMIMLVAGVASAQNLPSRWDELVASDWETAVEKSAATCILPIGILEKHGPHAPIGSDLIHVREWARRTAEREYAVVFPDFFFGQIYEARHQPGTFALPSRLVWDLLDATCEEIARNGFRKIMIINGHGGNPHLLRYFVQSQLERKRDYVVYLYDPGPDEKYLEMIRAERASDLAGDMHGGENETSSLLYLRPDLVKVERADQESGKSLNRVSLPDLYTAIWWYGSFPHHYAGDAGKATRELGRIMTEYRIESLATALRRVKQDTTAPQAQREFFDRVLR